MCEILAMTCQTVYFFPLTNPSGNEINIIGSKSSITLNLTIASDNMYQWEMFGGRNQDDGNDRGKSKIVS